MRDSWAVRSVSLMTSRAENLSARAGRWSATHRKTAVLVSGLTVIIAMSGMFLMGSSTFSSFAVGTVLVVAISIVGSLTVLPAVLSKLGDKVDRGRVPLLQRLRSHDGQSRLWATIVGGVLRRPILCGSLAAAALIALAIPAGSELMPARSLRTCSS
jgi:uncharacterized membrane protein YdfJ with MMPL/SSD domain